MSLMDRIFGHPAEYPPLPTESAAAQRIDNALDGLRKLIVEAGEPLELVPSEETIYVFIGRPPRSFALSWMRDGERRSFSTLVEERHVSEFRLHQVTEWLRALYRRHMTEPRWSHRIDGHAVVVIASPALAREIDALMAEVGGP
ncbi:MAG: hypothetical protein PVH31_04605 [Ectothiorhodospiraceae bacterium]|jgi:hypothetical protein